MRKFRKLIIMLLISLCTCGLTACQSKNNNSPGNTSPTANTQNFEQISAQEAKEIMDSGVTCIIIDARTDEEFSQGHIEGAILIPEYEIANRAEQTIADKNALILVYCRSGRRSKIACEELVNLGYTNVKEFGGIIDWPYEIVK